MKNTCVNITLCSETDDFTSSGLDRPCQPLCNWSKSYVSSMPTLTMDAVCTKLAAITCDEGNMEQLSTPTSDRKCIRRVYTSLAGPVTNPSCNLMDSYSAVNGSLILGTYANASLVASTLLHVDGSVLISGNSSLAFFSLPKLMSLAGQFGFDGALTPIFKTNNTAKVHIHLPLLRNAGGSFSVVNSKGWNANLMVVETSGLTFVGAPFRLNKNSVLKSIYVSHLQIWVRSSAYTTTLSSPFLISHLSPLSVNTSKRWAFPRSRHAACRFSLLLASIFKSPQTAILPFCMHLLRLKLETMTAEIRLILFVRCPPASTPLCTPNPSRIAAAGQNCHMLESSCNAYKTCS